MSKYVEAFEEALDQHSRVYFAASSARAQAKYEMLETQRQAATIYDALIHSQQRHERMRETIERSRTVRLPRFNNLAYSLPQMLYFAESGGLVEAHRNPQNQIHPPIRERNDVPEVLLRKDSMVITELFKHLVLI